MKESKMNLREMEVSGNQGQDVRDTAMFNATAHETQDTVSGDNPQKEYIAKDPTPGKLGAYGRC